MSPNTDVYFMQKALQLAQQAMEEGEIPVGAVVVCQDKIIGKGYNQTERGQDVTAHAEILALTAASNYLGAKYLNNCTLYVTLEPCVMCAGALFWAQIGRVVFAARDTKRGFSQISPAILHPKTRLSAGVLAEESESLLKIFFKRLRT
ncbi:nucleoside deaminase [Arundinibacter roseus]|uniref:tRNA-specific adenosine deaminase n=1 Tax=Arundinibacter roseus TaxID=2070510 RepID=A0A4R4KHB5_9BACT|nr:nucleoside deaminase [Arundinibacter roseus]TDB66031.1 nucleoside deaminase [Arundinibacter roseus]